MNVRFRGERTPAPKGGQRQVSVAAVIHGRNLNGCNRPSAAARERRLFGVSTEGPTAQACLRDRPRTPPELRRRTQDHRRHPRIGGDRTDPHGPRPIGPATQAEGARCARGFMRPASAPWFCGFTRRRPRRWTVAATSAPLGGPLPTPTAAPHASGALRSPAIGGRAPEIQRLKFLSPEQS